MIEMNSKTLSIRTSNQGWMRRVWTSVWRIRIGKFAGQAGFAEGYGMKANPVLELDRVNGKLVLMGRNETMKMLIQAPHQAPRDSRLGARPETGQW